MKYQIPKFNHFIEHLIFDIGYSRRGEQGFALVPMLILVLLVLVIAWEVVSQSQKFSDENKQFYLDAVKNGTTKECNFPPPDPCGLDSGSDFSRAGI